MKLACQQCGYDLDGLVKGPDAVVCPECAALTAHINGCSLLPESAWHAVGRRRWRYVWTPGLSSLVVVAGIVVVAVFAGPRLELGLAGLILVGVVWAATVFWASRDPKLAAFSPAERRAFLLSVGALSVIGVPTVWAVIVVVIQLAMVIMDAV